MRAFTRLRLPFRFLLLLLLPAAASAVLAQTKPAVRPPDAVVRIWDGDAWEGMPPDHWTVEGEEIAEDTRATGGILKVSNISKPVMEYFAPKAEVKKDKGMIILPGGGYHILAWDLEGTEPATWLSGLGYHVWVLKYRLPRNGDESRHLAGLQDTQRALSLVRSEAAKNGLNPDKLGVMGSSAGGHLAVMASTLYNERSYKAADDIDAVSCRPAFTILIHPAYLVKDADSTALEAAVKVPDDAPPAIMIHAADDPIPARNSVEWFNALNKRKIPAALHIYPDGGHGYGMRSDKSVKEWPGRVAEWLAR